MNTDGDGSQATLGEFAAGDGDDDRDDLIDPWADVDELVELVHDLAGHQQNLAETVATLAADDDRDTTGELTSPTIPVGPNMIVIQSFAPPPSPEWSSTVALATLGGAYALRLLTLSPGSAPAVTTDFLLPIFAAALLKPSIGDRFQRSCWIEGASLAMG